jgi:signal transduction histidine kinase
VRRRIGVTGLVVAAVVVLLVGPPLLFLGDRYAVADEHHDTGRRVRAALLFAALLAVTAVVVALLVTALIRRLLAPLDSLAADASRLAGGDLGPAGRRYGIEECDRLAEALDSAAVRLGELVRRERQLAADVSHQLRSRLTALSMRLEEVAAVSDPAVKAEAEAALDQVDRMVRIVDELLDQARTERAHNAVELDVADQLDTLRTEWSDAFRAGGREMAVTTGPGLRALATPGHVGQALGVLVENALQHGAGTVSVSARPHGEHVVVEVRDEGTGVPDPLVPVVFDRGVSGADGTGLGLALARALIEADSGRLELRSAHPAVYAVYLPRIS